MRAPSIPPWPGKAPLGGSPATLRAGVVHIPLTDAEEGESHPLFCDTVLGRAATGPQEPTARAGEGWVSRGSAGF